MKIRYKWGNPKFEYDEISQTVLYDQTNFFVKGRFENGYLLTFYSHSPCGCIHDHEKGWVIFDPKNKVQIDSCETRYCGQPAGQDFRGWMDMAKQEFGKLSYFKNENGTHIWKMNE